MKVYASFDDPRLPLREVPGLAQRAERIGFHGMLVPEAVHDGMFGALLALEHTRTLRVTTSVVLAFPRSPMTIAYAAWDLQSLSGGRFQLGLGSQVKGNIVGRFSVEWKPPVPRMRDYVRSLRAIWTSWQEGTKLAFESENYRFTRMQPFFNPGPIEHPSIPVFLGGVNPGMTRLAGAESDAFMTHPTNSNPRYLREVTRPLLREGEAAAGRPAGTVQLIGSTFVAAGATPEIVASERERIRQFFGFLYSTPQYWPTLELHGWAEVGHRLHQMTREGRWQDMTAEITDEILDALVPAGTYDTIARTLREWYDGAADGITMRMPDDPSHDPQLARVIAELQSP